MGICGQFRIYFWNFLSCNIIKISSLLHYCCSIQYVYVSIETFDCILLSLLVLSAILLISSVNTLRLLLLNLCSDFNINSLGFFYQFFITFSKTIVYCLFIVCKFQFSFCETLFFPFVFFIFTIFNC